MFLSFCRWFIGINGAMVIIAGALLGAQYVRGGKQKQTAMFEIGFTLLCHLPYLFLTAAAAVFDLNYPRVQFPIEVRLAITLPALLLTDIAYGRLMYSVSRFWATGMQ